MTRVAVLGGGKMGAALVGGLLEAGWDATEMAVAEIDGERRVALEQQFPKVRVVPSAAWAVADADVVVVAVKPGDVPATLETAQPALSTGTLVLTIAAGVTVATVERLVPDRPVVRAMPNTPALVGEGASAIAPGTFATAEHMDLAAQLLGAVGIVVRVCEADLDAVTGLSGSGPAYVFLVAESLIEAGVLAGLSRDVATELVTQTILGSATLLARDEAGPEVLRAAVTSPGGTTAAGLRELEAHGVRAAFLDAGRGGDASVARARQPVAMPNRGRPPHLESRVGVSQPAPPATPQQLLERAKVAGAVSVPGPTELRRFVERLVSGDRSALGELTPIPSLTMVDAWAAITETYGATPEHSFIDPDRTLTAAAAGAARFAEIAGNGGQIAFACAAPAALLTVYGALVDLARDAGAEIPDLDDIGPLRADGRSSRYLRFVSGVAVVSDGRTLFATRDGEAAREWLFVLGRPSLVVADGPFAEVAWEAGVEVVSLAGLDRCALAVAAARRQRCVLIPVRTDRPPRAYAPVTAAFAAVQSGRISTEL